MSTTITSSQTAKSVSFSAPFASSQRNTMSITQTYFLAHKARSKLSHQAARPDHDLRLLVGHANLLDTLMLELADAEREQESWFNQSVRGANSSTATATTEKDRHVQWADTVIEEPEEDWQAEDADDDSDVSSDSSSEFDSDEEVDDDEEDDEDENDSEESLDDTDMADAAPLRRVSSHHHYQQSKPTVTTVAVEEKEDSDSSSSEDDSDVEVDDDEEDYAQLTLTRSPSHSALPSARSPPELVVSEDSDDASEDEAMPPSPPAITIQSFNKKSAGSKTRSQTAQPASPETATQQEFDVNDRCYLPPRNPARLVSSISVF